MKKITIIVAGGSGKRMNSSYPKQFMLLKNKPVLMHSIEKFYEYDKNMEIRVVLPQNEMESWQKLISQFQFNIDHSVICGGEHRFHSVSNGLKDIPEHSIVAIHDGVRPLVNIKTISNCFEMAQTNGSAIPVLKLKDSIRQIKNGDSVALDRLEFRLVQTPQVFQSAILLKSYNTNFQECFTDDASVVESAGFQIFLTEGNEENIKITTQQDLLVAEAMMAD